MFIRVMICCSSSVACRLNWPSRSRATAVYVLVTAVRVYAATAADRSGDAAMKSRMIARLETPRR
jgi:hypothetical protein